MKIIWKKEQNSSEYSKVAQKENKTSYDWVGKVIYWELCKYFKFYHTTKWSMHKTESLRVNETQKDYEIKKKDYRIPVRKPDLVLIFFKERTCCLMDFAVSVDHRVKILKSGKDRQIQRL